MEMSEKTYSVLIVDDSLEDRYLLKRSLSRTGLSLVVLEADGGQPALDILSTPLDKLREDHPAVDSPIVLFLDINMPGMNGWEFLEILSKKENEIRVKPMVVMMYSTSDGEADISKARQDAKVAGYLVKGSQTPSILRDSILECMKPFQS